ncbi:MAG: TIM barrel protein [Saprospiraceae bacterium]|nr:TIM barrel protein [Saprospiraceae bacterium]
MKTCIWIWMVAATVLVSCKNEKKAEEGIKPTSQLSLAEWSFHQALKAGEMNNLEFAGKAAALGFTGIEYVNQFFKDKAENTAYLDSLNAAAKAAGVTQVLIMIDEEGYLGDADSIKRMTAVKNHQKWVLAAKHLGCHSIRVNAHGEGTAEEVKGYVVNGLGALCDFAAQHGINVIVENHGGYSSNGQWLTDVMKTINKANCGTLPDFGNFCVKRKEGDMWGSECIEEYDRYKGVEELLPFAKGVSAKSYDFDAQGNETKIDFARMLQLVKASGYQGFIGVEYEGKNLGEQEGIEKTKALLERMW